MKNEDFELKLIVRQNAEMAVKLQTYRRQNSSLSAQNQHLNTCVQNLSQVFASISSAWKSITESEEALYNLIKKKSDPNSKAIVNKYISHFKTFEDITTNLGEKITNVGHSQESTQEAKARLSAFVSNYYLFFMQFVENLFKFNEEYSNWLLDTSKLPDLPQLARNIIPKEQENRQKIKDFEGFMRHFKQNSKVYESFNQHKLLNGMLQQKNEEIQKLKQFVANQARNISLLNDYNCQSVAETLENENQYECLCGGKPLKYFKQVWEENLKKSNQTLQRQQSEKEMRGEEPGESNIKREEYLILESEKKLLIEKNASLQSRIEKMKTQNKLSEDFILNSEAYSILKDQCRELMDYTSDLVTKLNKSYHLLSEIQKSRNEEIDQLKRKYQKTYANKPYQENGVSINSYSNNFANFKSEVLNSIVGLKAQFNQLNKKSIFREEKVLKSSEMIKIVTEENKLLNTKLEEILEKQNKMNEKLEFRHQIFNELEVKINGIMKNHPEEEIKKLKKNWESFIEYVKTRDKKIKGLEDTLKRRDKEILQKQKLEEVLKENLEETEHVYIVNKEKLDKFEAFVTKTQKQLLNLSEDLYKLKIDSEQEKNVMNMRLKAQIQAKAKIEEKLKSYEKIEEQVLLVQKAEKQMLEKYLLLNDKYKQNTLKLQLSVKEMENRIQKLQWTAEDYEKTIERLSEDRQKQKAEINHMLIKSSAYQKDQMIRMEMEEYKQKIMCNCNSDREREVILKTCFHAFCKKCITDITVNRSRRCSFCNTKFSKTDIQEIHWT